MKYRTKNMQSTIFFIAPYRGFYYIESTHGERVIAANALDWGNNEITYRVSWNFNHAYHEILPIGNINQWSDSNLVAKWLDSLIYILLVSRP